MNWAVDRGQCTAYSEMLSQRRKFDFVHDGMTNDLLSSSSRLVLRLCLARGFSEHSAS